jgi:hypothetical protein
MILQFDRSRIRAIDADLSRLDATPLGIAVKIDLVAEKLALGGYPTLRRDVQPPCDTEA